MVHPAAADRSSVVHPLLVLPAILALLLVVAAPLPAEDPPLPARGDTIEVTDVGTLSVSATNATFDPEPVTGLPTRHTLSFEPGANQSRTLADQLGTGFIGAAVSGLFGYTIPSWVFDVIGLVGGSPASLTLGPTGTFGGYFEVADVGKGDLDAAWPVTLDLTLPAPNSFACGDTVELRTKLTAAASSAMTIDPPYHEVELGFSSSGVGVEASLEVCTPSVCLVPPFAPDKLCVTKVGAWCLSDHVPTTAFYSPLSSHATQPMITVCEELFDPYANWTTGGMCGKSTAIFTASTMLHAQPDHSYVHLTSMIPKVPELDGRFRHPRMGDLALSRDAENRVLTLAGTRKDVVNLDLDLVSLLDYLCTTCPIGINPTRVSIPAVGSLDLGDVTMTYATDQEMRFTLTPTFRDLVGVEVSMVGQQLAPDGTSIGSASAGTEFTITPGNTLSLDFPSDRSTPAWIGGIYGVDGSLDTLTTQKYFIASEFRLLDVDFSSVGFYSDSLIDETLFRTPAGGATIEQAVITRPGTTFDGARYSLDPENPVVEVSSFELRDTLNLGRGERAVVYRVTLHNGGDVPLLEAHAQLDLEEAYLDAGAGEVEVACVYSADLELDTRYDGLAHVELLADGNTLAVDQTSWVEVLVRVVPARAPVVAAGCFEPVAYDGHGHAEGTSPIGTLVHNNWNQCTEQATGVDLVATVDLGAAAVDDLDDFTVYGFEAIHLSRGMRLSLGNVGTGGSLHVLPLRHAAPGDPRVVGDLHVAGDVHVVQGPFTCDYAQVGGAVITGDPRAQLVATGATSDFSGCVAQPVPPALPATPPPVGMADVVLKPGERRDLAPGAYGLVQLPRGARLDLAAGDYDIARLRVTGDDAALIFAEQGGTLLLHDWQMGPVRRLLLGAGTGSTRRVRVEYTGDSKQVFREAVLAGTFVAPYAALELREASTLLGNAWAARVLVDEGSRFAGHRYLEALKVGGDCADALHVH